MTHQTNYWANCETADQLCGILERETEDMRNDDKIVNVKEQRRH